MMEYNILNGGVQNPHCDSLITRSHDQIMLCLVKTNWHVHTENGLQSWNQWPPYAEQTFVVKSLGMPHTDRKC